MRTPDNLGLPLPEGLLIYSMDNGRLLKAISLPDGIFNVPFELQSYGLLWALDGARLLLPRFQISLTTNTVTPRIGQATGYFPERALPAALRYRWSPDGKIVPAEAMPPSSPSVRTGAPKSADDGASFSFWQDGALVAIPPYPRGLYAVKAPTYYVTAFTRWSPDGASSVIALPVAATPLQAPSGETQQLYPADVCLVSNVPPCSPAVAPEDVCLVGGAPPCSATIAPYPDEALAHVAQTIAQTPVADWENQLDFALLAWRPDGGVLATMLPGDGFGIGKASIRVSLLDTATGATRTTLRVR